MVMGKPEIQFSAGEFSRIFRHVPFDWRILF
jgi:hypothetical protein